MEDLIKQERFEIEVLEYLNSGGFLKDLVFCGGTMLRLCFGLNRFSVDLDFWIIKDMQLTKFYNKLKSYLNSRFTITDSMNKYRTILFEIKSRDYPRKLKIEIRKEKGKIEITKGIAFSRYTNKQVLVNIPSLEEIMESKINALIERKEIRDAFDIEFLLRRGIELDEKKERLLAMLKVIDSFSKKDYTTKLGSILEAPDRDYYNKENFNFLKMNIMGKTNKNFS